MNPRNSENPLKIFAFEDHLVRVADRAGNPWFVLVDVCRVLDHSNPSVAARRLDQEEKTYLNIAYPSSNGISQNREVTIISESGLWSLVLTSRKPEARRFKKWVTAEVLPEIRRTGQYSLPGLGPASDLPEPPALDFEHADGRLSIAARIDLVRLALRIFGRKGAARAWDMAGLPCILPEKVEEMLAATPPCVAGWISAHCVRETRARTQASVLYEDYTAMMEGIDRRPVSRPAFAAALVAAGFESRKSSVIYWHGIALADQATGQATGQERAGA